MLACNLNDTVRISAHQTLVSANAHRIIQIAREHGAVGWKVNGAGGEGGSVTILCDSRSSAKRAMISLIEKENSLFMNIPVYISRYGVRTWEQGNES